MTEQDALRWIRSRTELQLGSIGEAVCKAVCQASRVHYVPLAQLAMGGAPRIVTDGYGIVLPDFDCAAAGWVAYLEAKCKTQNILYRIRNQVRHGIDFKNWKQYKLAATQYRKQCGLFIVECFHDQHIPVIGGHWSGEFMVQTLDELGDGYVSEWSADNAAKVYWRKNQFVNLGRLTPVELFQVANGRKLPPSADNRLRDIFAPMKQTSLF